MSYIRRFLLERKYLFQKLAHQKIESKRRNLMLGKVSFAEYRTMLDIKRQLINMLQVENYFTTEPKSRTHLLKHMPKSQDELPMRKMSDSFDIAIIPLSENLELRDKYTTFRGSVRFGRLMEDVDLFAVWCSIKHINISQLKEEPIPYSIVTVRMDHINFTQYMLKTDMDIRISGHVCWVGKSSLEVVVWLDQEIDGKWQRITRALILMAARNSDNTGPGLVNKIIAETPKEKKLLLGGEERKLQRLKMNKESLLKTVPTEAELHIIHQLFMETSDSKEMFLRKKTLPPNSSWMHEANLKNVIFCHPEHRNLNNKIFGGFIIRQALELSFSVGYLYTMEVPKLVHISDISFYNPVDVGSILKLDANITYTEKDYIQVLVHAEALSTSDPKGKSTNSFNFTFRIESPFNKVYPFTYLEAMMYIDGKRHYNYVMELAESLNQVE